MTTSIYDSDRQLSPEQQEETVNFLFEHLGRYGDPRDDIGKAIDYALGRNCSDGGFVARAQDGTTLVGAAVINRTGMERYIPGNILVYIAVHGKYRGQGFGRRLLREVLGRTQGGVALHVEPDNPARRLYESLGFTNKYLEMRFDGKEVL